MICFLTNLAFVFITFIPLEGAPPIVVAGGAPIVVVAATVVVLMVVATSTTTLIAPSLVLLEAIAPARIRKPVASEPVLFLEMTLLINFSQSKLLIHLSCQLLTESGSVRVGALLRNSITH